VKHSLSIKTYQFKARYSGILPSYGRTHGMSQIPLQRHMIRLVAYTTEPTLHVKMVQIS